jgi:argininosuccinate lyase-like protein
VTVSVAVVSRNDLTLCFYFQGVPFREAHHCVGSAVQLAEDRGCRSVRSCILGSASCVCRGLLRSLAAVSCLLSQHVCADVIGGFGVHRAVCACSLTELTAEDLRTVSHACVEDDVAEVCFRVSATYYIRNYRSTRLCLLPAPSPRVTIWSNVYICV